ncbi:preprotein translocase subunit TatC [Clostridiales bacterium PH28_bin88]|nr:preprotein translocase subunit TatC [Clostridiales bacterium PH28_bin88]
MTLVEHLEELRKVLVISTLAVAATTLVIFFLYREPLFQLATAPLTELNLPLIYIAPTEALFTKLKISAIAGVIISLPVVMWQVWSFVMPALHYHERRIIYVMVPSSMALFITGVLFAYYTVFRFAARFLLVTAGQGLEAMITVSKYVSFLVSFLLPFGLVFELPLVVLLLTRLGLVTPKFLAKNRKYAILITFVIAAALTPGPDVVSQLLMAGPMIILYELSILISRVVKAKKKAAEAEAVDEG